MYYPPSITAIRGLPFRILLLVLALCLGCLAASGQTSTAKSIWNPGSWVTPYAGTGGTISPNTKQWVAENHYLTLTATPDPGYVVDGWYVYDTYSQKGGTTFRVFVGATDLDVSVAFKHLPCLITPTAGANGSISPSTPQSVTFGDTLTFSAIPTTGYMVDGWQLDGQRAQTGGNTYTLNNIGGNHTVQVLFTQQTTATVTPAAGANGNIYPYNIQSVLYGGSLTFSAAAYAGYTVDCWYLDGTTIQAGGAGYILPYITADHTVRVTFRSTSVAGQPGNDWNMFHHDRLHTGRSAYNGPVTNAARWWFTLNIPAEFASPAIGPDGTIYIAGATSSYDYGLYAVNPDGSQKWFFRTNGQIYVAPAIGIDGTVYTGTGSNNFYAINPNGSQKWCLHPGNIVSSPTIGADGTIYIGAQDSRFHAITPAGTEKWVFSTGLSTNDYNNNVYLSAPAIANDGTIYFAIAGNQVNVGDIGLLYALNPDGTRKWNQPFKVTGGEFQSSPAIGADGTIYLGTLGAVSGNVNNHLYAVNPNGTQKWTFATGEIVSSPAIATDGTIYIGSLNHQLYAVNANGTQKWVYTTGANVSSSVAIGANGTVYVSSDDGNLYALTAAGTKLWAAATGSGGAWSSPAIGADGTIYLGTQSGKLAAIGPKPSLTLVKAVAPTIIAPGGTVTYTLTCSNTGGLASNTQVTDMLPANITYLPGSAIGPVSYNAAAHTLTWSLGQLATTAGMSFQAVVNASIAAGTTVANTAIVTCNELSAPVVSNAATCKVMTFTVTPRAGTHGTITPDSAQTVNPDGSLTFTATPATGYTVGSWYLDGQPVQSGGVAYLLNHITADHTVLVSFAVTAAGAGDWWMFHHDRQHTGRSAFTGPATATVKWTYAFAAGKWADASPVIGLDGTVYLGCTDNALYAINPDGTKKWVFPVGNPIYATPAIDADGTIYCGAFDGSLYAVNPDGTAKWTTPFHTGKAIHMSSPVIGANGMIYLGSDKKLFAINPDGTSRWTFLTGDVIDSSPAIGTDGTIYVGSQDNNLYAINPDGSKQWAFVAGKGDQFASSPAIGADGTIYVGSGNKLLYAVNPNGMQKWAFATTSSLIASPAIGADGTVYIGDEAGFCYAVSASGSQRWRFGSTASIVSSPAIGADGAVYVGSQDMNLYALDTTGHQKWAVKTGGNIIASPTIGCDGAIYLGSRDGKLYAIGAPAPFPRISKSVAVTSGDFVTYTIAYANAGNKPATNVVITDRLPAGMGFAYGSTTGGGTYNAGVVSWTLGTLNAGATGQVSFQAITNPVTRGTCVVNTATITCSEVPTPVVSNTATLSVRGCAITPSAGANGTISPSSPQSIPYGGSVTFTAVANAGATVDTWTLDNTAVQLGGAGFALPCVTADHAVKVTFKSTNGSGPVRGDWWMFHHDLQHTGRSLFNGPEAPTQKWNTPFATGSSSSKSSPAIGTDGTIYLGSDNHQLYAVTAGGALKWAFTAGGAIDSSPAIGTDGTIYVGAEDNKLYAVNPDGTPKWTTPFATGGPITSSPAIGADGTIYVGSTDKYVYAVTPAGKVKWFDVTQGAVSSSPAIGSDGTIYVGSADHKLYAINPDGSDKWSFITNDAVLSSPTIGTDGTIYVGSGALYAINPDGSFKWSFSPRVAITATPAIGADGTIYVGSRDDNVYAVSPDGIQRWILPTLGGVTASPAIGGDGTIYIGSEDSRLYAISPNNLMKWTFTAGGPIYASPALGADGSLYVASANGKLYALGAPSACLNVAKSVSAIGTAITYTLAYGDNGTLAATNATLTDRLPSGLNYVAGSANGGGTLNAATNTLTWSLGLLNPGTAVQVSFLATPSGGGTPGANITNTATIACSEAPAPMVSNAATVCTVTSSAGANGVVLPAPLQVVVFGGGITFTAAANYGYTADSWSLDGTKKQTGKTTYTLSNVTVNHTVSVTFKALPTFTVTPTAGVNGSITPNTPQSVPLGSGVAFTAIANAGYTAESWSLDGTKAQTGGTTFILSNVTANHTVSVTFTALPTFTVTPTAGAGGAISPNTPQSVPLGSKVVFTATANAGYTAESWLLDGMTAQTGGMMYTVSNITASHQLNVTFKVANPAGIRGDWWMFHHDPQHTGRSAFTGPGTPLVKWARNFGTGNALFASPVIGNDGTLYIGSYDHRLYAVNPSNGTRQWVFSTGAGSYASPAIGTDGTLYLAAGDCTLYAITPGGTPKWTFATGYSSYGMTSSPVIGPDGTIYVGANDGHLYAINPNGTQKWAFTTSARIDSSPALGADGTIYFGCYDANLYAVNPNGTRKWAFATRDWITSSPAIGADGTIYVGSWDANLYAVNPNGTPQWAFQTGMAIASSPAIGTDGAIYCGSDDGCYYAFNPDGTPRWVTPTGGPIESSPAIGADGTSYSGSYDGTLTAIGPSGMVRWMFPIGGGIFSSPAIGTDGTIYLGGLDGALYAIGNAAKSPARTTGNPTNNPTATPVTACYQPDLAIGNPGDTAETGLGTIDTDGAGQTTNQTTPTNATATYRLQLQNAGTTADSFLLTCPPPPASGWTVQLIEQSTGNDLSNAITGKGSRTATLPAGGMANYTLYVTPGPVAVSHTAYPLLLTATSVGEMTKQDAVKAVTTKE